MRKITLPLLAGLCWLPAASAFAGPYRAVVPVVVESRAYSTLPRDPATTQDVDIGRDLIGYEAPANVDVYALTEDEVSEIPVVSIDRRIVLRPIRGVQRHRSVLSVKG